MPADPSMPPRIRPAAPSDSPFLLEVLRLSALSTYPELVGLGRISLGEKLEVWFAEYDRPEARRWILENAGLPAAALWGLHAIHPILDEAEFLVVAVATLPEKRGHGFARALMDHAVHAARREGARSIRLFAHPDNAAAMHLYVKQGFTSHTLELRRPLG